MTLRLRGLFLLPGLLVASTALAADLEAEISASPYYTSNAFGLKDEWIDSFDLKKGPGGRFPSLNSPWDFVTPLRGAGGSRWKLREGMRFTASGAVAYEQYLQNQVASHAELRVGGSLETGKSARTRARLDWTPQRYKRDYEHPDLAADQFLQAHYGQWGLVLDHKQRLGKNWTLQVEAAHESRSYDAPFANRDRTLWAGGLGVEVDLSKRVSVEVGSKLGTARSPGGMEEGIVVDRSFDEIKLASRFVSRLSVWRAALYGEILLRDYTTANSADVSRFERRDRTWEIGTQWERRLGPRETLSLRLAHARRQSDRPADLNDPDVVPYNETVFGAGITHRF